MSGRFKSPINSRFAEQTCTDKTTSRRSVNQTKDEAGILGSDFNRYVESLSHLEGVTSCLNETESLKAKSTPPSLPSLSLHKTL